MAVTGALLPVFIIRGILDRVRMYHKEQGLIESFFLYSLILYVNTFGCVTAFFKYGLVGEPEISVQGWRRWWR